jgi:ArsR family transcriptional regulator, arsenate/arsenite/antimonite-responsive transcriptional repressor
MPELKDPTPPISGAADATSPAISNITANATSNPVAIDGDALLKLILDEERLAILGLTAQRPYSVSELAALLPNRRNPAAKQVAQLVEAGLLIAVDSERYALDVRRLQQWKRTLFARVAPALAESEDEQILATYVRDGKLAQYPAQQSKRLVVLKWLASHFEPGRDYSEREVNELLSGHSEDYATLRRYLVDMELLARNAGVYRRTVS